MRAAYSTVDSTVWTAYLEVLETGEPREVDPVVRPALVGGESRTSRYRVRTHRLGEHLVVSWVRHDADARGAERIGQTERLGNLGWGEWDLTTGGVEWSDGLYRIFERDPALGPMSNEETDALALPEDDPIRMAGAEAFVRGEQLDVVYRARINGRVKHLRTVIDAVRDVEGQPLKIYGIVQDVTTRETTRARLAEVERQLDEQRRNLAAEHRLASQLQQIILPVPDAPVDLPGVRVAVRYLPAEHRSRVGGDWYHAGPLPGGPVLLAIGDVAGHGLPAATTMARMRHALGALTVTTTDPAELMAYLNQVMCGLSGETPMATATAVIARYDPDSASLTWAQAGHPPPLFTEAGTTVALPRPAGPLLGVMDDAVYETATVGFRPGNVLLLYTDGLVEHRSLTLDEGLASVIRSVDAAIASAPEQPLAALLARLPWANPDDDTCLLAARPIRSGGPT
jgi:serine phosphatase RsbU (regulator of sigma subunit)